ncbi:MAG TPA: class I SAM-dependent methyltransferase [Balneolales bacterium]|nr:class I SAM-dependent methyltransferase [Balneolales bacterium]
MEVQVNNIQQQQKESWNKFSPGWKKWDGLVMDFLHPMGEETIRSLNLKETDTVLDVASGTGEPGLTISSVVSEGKVVLTDLSEGMLSVARNKALRNNILNCEFHNCGACELPFANAVFDAVSCRLGFMFVPDMHKAAKEMARVLKPGGRVSITVWGAPEKNFWVTCIMDAIKKHLPVAPPPPGAPGMFRCADSLHMTNLLKQAGFKNIEQTEINGLVDYGSCDTYWENMNDVGAAVVMALSRAGSETRSKIKQTLYELIHQKCQNGKVRLEYCAVHFSGEK